MSVPPPAANASMMRIGRSGYARAALPAAAAPAGASEPVGEIDFGGRVTTGLGDVGRFQSYSDPRSGPTLNRLLANQGDLGAAIVPFYGQQAGDQLAELLTTHIDLAVPVLEAAQAGDDAALQPALDDWNANARAVADFLAAADPDNWPQSATRPALEMHIDQTTAYAVDLLTGEYATAIQHYDAAYEHMLELADTLSAGIVERFPDRFDA